MKAQFEKWIWISVPLIVAMSAAGRHIYNLTNQAEILAPFVPINKSVWEYLKTLFSQSNQINQINPVTIIKKEIIEQI